ncbi:hypothetical protein SISSUDRAFT_984986 [Sistotremastrum suecicum HHB10207 ss-3]|uniref:Uncharacterized protein n=1 Tax=Sistotremastrum suecicum HHB10207 ss-3 TaxID=1314776 RepID=A0A166E7H5_9AGAM|nr:hypothetical protein SISSUDRAFT_984986 [Sistotremastrum suecicum HHB10207 ss-3]
MLFISETVHAAIADILSTTPSLSSIVKSNPIQGRLRVVCLAILHISQSFLTADGTVHGVLGHDITLNNCPPNLRHLMSELGAIGGIVEKMKQEDEDAALALSYSLEDAEQDLGSDDSFELNLESNIERLKKRLIGEAGYRESLTSEPACVRDVEGRIGRLGKHVMSLGSFKEREDIVFEILVGVTS